MRIARVPKGLCFALVLCIVSQPLGEALDVDGYALLCRDLGLGLIFALMDGVSVCVCVRACSSKPCKTSAEI